MPQPVSLTRITAQGTSGSVPTTMATVGLIIVGAEHLELYPRGVSGAQGIAGIEREVEARPD